MAGKHPKYVQELPGHCGIDIPLDTYSHVITGMDGGLADAMDEALSAPSSGAIAATGGFGLTPEARIPHR